MKPPLVILVLVPLCISTVCAQLSISNDPGVKSLIAPGSPVPAGPAPFGPGINPGTGLPPLDFNPAPAPPPATPNLGGPLLPGLGPSPAATAPAMPSLAPGMPSLGPAPPSPGPAMPSLGSGLGGAPPAPAVRPQVPTPTASPAAEQRIASAVKTMYDHLNAGRLQEALDAASEALRLSEEGFGPESLVVARRRMEIAIILRQAGSFREAMDWAEKAVGLEQKVGDTQSVDYALGVQRLGEIYLDVGQQVPAQRAFKLSYELLKEKLPERDPSLVTAMHNLGTVGYLLGAPDAKELLTKALGLRLEMYGANSVQVATSSAMLARCFLDEKDYSTAEKLMKASLKFYRSQGKAQLAMTLRVLDDLVTCHLRAGQLEEAEAYLLEEETAIRNELGEDHPLYGGTLSNRADLSEARGDAAGAERYNLEQVERFRKQGVAGTSGAINAQGRLASFYVRQGELAKAEACYREALAAVERTEGAEAAAAAVLGAMAKFYSETMVNYGQAERCLRQMLAIQTQKLHVKGDPIAMTDLAQICYGNGRDNEAVELLRLVLKQEKAAASPNEEAIGIASAKLAEIEGGADVMALSRQAIAQNTGLLDAAEAKMKTDPSAETEVASACSALASSYLGAAEPAAAEKFARRAHEICQRLSISTGALQRESLRSLIYALHDQKKDKEATTLMPEWMAGEHSRMDAMLELPTKEEQVKWLGGERLTELPASLRKARETALMLLRTKGLHIDVELAKTGGGETPVRSLLSTTIEQVQENLPAHSAVLDYFSFGSRERGGAWVNRYGVVVLRPGKEPVLHVTKHTAEQVDEMAGYFRVAMRQHGEQAKKDAAIESLHQAFYQMILGPVEKELKGVQTLYICPDSQLQFVPFATLLDAKGRFLTERFDTRLLTSARDLIRGAPREEAAGQKRVAVFAAADYRLGQGTPPPREITDEEKSRFADFLSERNAGMLSPLPGTSRELALIGEQGDAAGWAVDVFRGGEAREPRLRELAPPNCLHIATHGFSLVTTLELEGLKRKALTRRDPRRNDPTGVVDMRMDRSGVLLAGAKDSLDLWRKGFAGAPENDGILTADEAARLNLQGTHLVFLSACDTGAGAGTSPAGVVTLRSAFLHAGARHVISTLWPMSGEGAAGVVGEFYGRYFASGDVGAAFHETQRDWLLRVRKSQGLWEAVNQAGAFTLVSTRAGK